MPNVLRPAIVLVSLFLASCSENIETAYVDFNHAKEDRAIERNILPVWFPPESSKIFETHNLDTGLVSIVFELDNARSYFDDLPFCEKAIEPEPPIIHLKQFPSAWKENENVLACENYYVVVDQTNVFMWSNGD